MKNLIIEYRWGDFFKKATFWMALVSLIFTLCIVVIGFIGLGKIDYLSQRLQIGELADRCMWLRFDGGDYESYRILKNMGKESKDIFVRSTVDTQISKLRSSYFYGSDTLVVLIPINRNDGEKIVVEGDNGYYDWNNIFAHRKHSFWQSRARSAYLLRQIPKELLAGDSNLSKANILENLIDRIKNDESLVVRKTALDSFRILTNFEENIVNHIFDFEEANSWFAENFKKN